MNRKLFKPLGLAFFNTMKLNKLLTKKGIIFLLIFSILVFVGDRINFSKLVGAENQFFTLFQFFGPVAGAFLGPVVGVLSVLIAESSSYIMLGKEFTLIGILRLLPMLFAAWYFGTKKDKISFLVPVAAIALFIAHPVGRQAWFFSLFWAIPLLVKLVPEKHSRALINSIIGIFIMIVVITSQSMLVKVPVVIALLAALAIFNLFPYASSKSLGATFTAHAVGGAMWNYIVPMTPAAWIALIPIVIFERLLFASGISISFLGLNTLLDKLDSKTKAEYINVDKRHVMFRHAA